MGPTLTRQTACLTIRRMPCGWSTGWRVPLGKPGAADRTEAVAEARQLGLVA